MSSEEPKETLAGHPPAVKVGGMRVGQHHTHHPELKTAERAKQEEEFQTEKPDEGAVVVGGAVSKGNKDFSPEAASVAHQKPLPTLQKTSKGPKSQISQPRKFNN
ncbi:death-associated protein 1 homolog [Rhopilema esculentum]|uniref:death-associated protein 1 homolog n=1 Tax=Rhopilema esculentum TaxID=499914 RepID=UPI0031E112DF|eukprot:gene13342-4190_t